MQIACPKCGQPLKLAATAGQRVAVKCPKCAHAFQTVAPAAAPEPDFSSAFDSLPPATSPRNPQPTFRQPQQSFPRAQPAARSSRSGSRAKASNSARPLIIASVVGGICLLLAAAGLFLWTQNRSGTASGDPSQSEASFLGSLVPKVFRSDTPEIIFDEYMELQSDALERQVSLKRFDEAEIDRYREGVKETNRESRELLHRALALPPCTTEQYEQFVERQKQYAETMKSRMQTHLDSLGEAQKERLKQGLLDDDARKDFRFAVMLMGFLQRGFQEVGEQDGEQSKIYAREVELMRRLNRFLADVDADGVSSDSAATMESFADELVELGAERSTAKGGGLFVERVLGESGEAHRGLITMYLAAIEDQSDTDEAFRDAAKIFREAQKRFDRAKGDQPDELRSEFAEFKREIKHPELVAQERQERIAKAASSNRKPSPAPKTEPSADQASPTDSRAASSPTENKLADAGSGSASTMQPETREPETPTKRLGEVLRERSGIGRGGPRGGTPGGSRSRPSGPSFGPPRGPSGFPSRSPFRPGMGPRSAEEARAEAERRMKRFEGDSGVTVLFPAPNDLPETAKQWGQRLGINESMISASAGEAKLMLRWTGSVKDLAAKITFAEVLEIDERRRQIRVKLE